MTVGSDKKLRLVTEIISTTKSGPSIVSQSVPVD